MITDGRYQGVWLNNVALSSVHPSILVQHISEGELEYNQTLLGRPLYGNFVARNSPAQREITIEFAIREGLDYARRTEAYQAVCAWAAEGGCLELSSHVGQQIYVICKKLPSLGRLREWNEDMAITFEAARYPFWIDKSYTVQTVSASSGGTIDMSVLGSHETCLELEVTPTGNSMSTVIVGANDKQMLIDLSSHMIPAAETLKLYYDQYHYLHIEHNGTGLLKYRMGSDDIPLKPGVNSVTYTIGVPCDIAFKSRGVWV